MQSYKKMIHKKEKKLETQTAEKNSNHHRRTHKMICQASSR